MVQIAQDIDQVLVTFHHHMDLHHHHYHHNLNQFRVQVQDLQNLLVDVQELDMDAVQIITHQRSTNREATAC